MATSGLDHIRIDIPLTGESRSARDDIPSTGESGSSRDNTFKILEDALDEMQSDKSENPKPLIRKVPFARRDADTFHKYYEPRVVTIGPIHHDENKFKLSEKVKQKLAALFIRENKLEKTVLHDKIKSQIKKFKKCYNEEDIDKRYWDDDEKLVSILFVDGCAVLQYMHYVAERNETMLKELKIKSDQAAFAYQDLFLLENQLPYQVLETLIDCFPDNGKKEQMKKSILKFIHSIVKHTRGEDIEEKEDQSALNNLTHLLELFRKQLLRPHQDVKQGENEQLPHPHQGVKQGENVQSFETAQKVWFSFRNVNELKATGIQLASETKGYLEDISFNSRWLKGTLKLPSLIVDDSTAPKLLNLIAYEMCPDFRNNFEVSSYVSFLDTLIDEPNDVKELRDAKVLCNLLGSDTEVAKIFNEIGTDLVPDPSTYGVVRRDIQRHYDKPWRTHIAQGLYTHFSSPWTVIAFIGAILALIFGVVQTACSIISAMVDFKDLKG